MNKLAQNEPGARPEGEDSSRPNLRLAMDDDTRPTIRLVPGELHTAIEAGIAALRADPGVFQRDHKLVFVTRAEMTDRDGEHASTPGSPKVHEMVSEALRPRLTRCARWVRPARTKSGEQFVCCNPPEDVVGGILCAKLWPGILNLKGIIEWPSFRPDGTVLDTPGYDRKTGFLYVPSGQFLPVADRPTQDDARRAYAALAGLFDDFPYATPAGQSMVVAAILTLLGRPAIAGGTPAFVFDATTPGSGKTLQVDVCAAIATGRESGRQHFPFVTGLNKDIELAKVLGAISRSGAALVNFDNLDPTNGVFGGSALEECITARDTHTFRVLGITQNATVSWRTVVFGTGNNVELSGDMKRRSLVARLESPFENPEVRPRSSYKRPELAGRLFEHAIEHRAEYVHHALTLLRAYFVAGRPLPADFQPMDGGFEPWSTLIVGALLWVGAPNPLECCPSLKPEENPDRAQHRVLAQEWDAFCRATSQSALTVYALLSALYPKDRSDKPDPKWETLRGAVEFFAPPKPGCAPDAHALGTAIGKLKGAPVRTSDYGPTRCFALDGLTHGRARWKIADCVDRREQDSD